MWKTGCVSGSSSCVDCGFAMNTSVTDIVCPLDLTVNRYERSKHAAGSAKMEASPMQHVTASELVLRAMTTEDIAGGLRLCRASGWNQLEEDWRLFIDSPGSGGWLIERAGNILGTAACIRYDSLAWIAMMLGDPAQRRAGPAGGRGGGGARLVSAALAAVADVPCAGLDATPAGEPLYRRFGFVEAYSLV